MVLTRGTRRAVCNSSFVMGRASKSAFAAVCISSLVIERIGVSVNGRSSPSSNTSTIDPLDRIFAVVIVLFMFFCPSGRYESNAVTTLRVCHMEKNAITHAE